MSNVNSKKGKRDLTHYAWTWFIALRITWSPSSLVRIKRRIGESIAPRRLTQLTIKTENLEPEAIQHSHPRWNRITKQIAQYPNHSHRRFKCQVIMPRCACTAKAYGILLVFLSVCLSVILSVTGIAAQRVQFKCWNMHRWVQSHVFSDLNWLDFWDKAWFSMYS